MAYKSRKEHHKCTLPSILDTYQPHDLTDKTHNEAKPLTQRSFGSINKKEASTFQMFIGLDPDPDELAQLKHKALQDQHHLEVYWSMYRLRDEMAHHYAALLKEKVLRQRQEIRQREEHFIQTRHRRTKKKKRRQEDQQLSRITVSHDETYLRSLPKTTYYLILEVQRQLLQHGYLKTRQDWELFNQWLDQHRRGNRLRGKLNEMVISSNSTPSLKFESLMKQGSQLLKSHDKGPQEDTAVGRLGMLGASRGSPPNPGGKQAQERDGAKQMFPKTATQLIRRPKFSALQPGFMDSFRTTVLTTAPKLPERLSVAGNLMKLRLMHSLSLTNMAYSQRLLSKGGPIWEAGYEMRHLTDYISPHAAIVEADQITRGSNLSSLSQRSSSIRTTSDEEQDKVLNTAFCPPRAEPESSPLNRESWEGKTTSVHPEEPLSMDHILQQNTPQVEYCSVRMWQNYS